MIEGRGRILLEKNDTASAVQGLTIPTNNPTVC